MNAVAPDRFIIYNGPREIELLYCFSSEYELDSKYIKFRARSLKINSIDLYLKVSDISFASSDGLKFLIWGVDNQNNYYRGYYNSVSKTGYLE
jgi:hypothetical protein